MATIRLNQDVGNDFIQLTNLDAPRAGDSKMRVQRDGTLGGADLAEQTLAPDGSLASLAGGASREVAALMDKTDVLNLMFNYHAAGLANQSAAAVD